MLFRNFFILILSLILVVSCGLKQPEDTTENNLLGSIYVTSSVDSARIFVNSSFTEKVTPDTIKNLPVGTSIVQVFKDGYLISPDSIVVTVNTDSIVSADFSMEYITNQGKLFINSAPVGAAILVDNSTSGKFTPDTIIVAAGFHQFDLYKNGFDSLEVGNIEVLTNTLTSFDEILTVEKQVLIESFANSSCLPCTTTNTYLEDFIANHNESEYALIEYFTSWPNFLDPMYLHNTAGSSARFDRDFYDIVTVPSMLIDGSTVNALDYSNIQNTFDSKLLNATQDISISLSQQITDSVRVNVEINQFNTMPTGDWRLFIAVIEKHVAFSQPPGANGLSDFSHVFRKFLTANEGDQFSFTNNQFIKTYVGSISSEWDLSDIQIIGFIQDITSKAVIKSSHL